MRLSCTVTKIWRLKDNGVTSLTFWGSRDIIGHVTIRLAGVDFLWVVRGDHASIWYSYGDIAPQMLDHSSRKRFFRFFENSKNVTFYVFLNDLSKKRKKRNYINTA